MLILGGKSWKYSPNFHARLAILGAEAVVSPLGPSAVDRALVALAGPPLGGGPGAMIPSQRGRGAVASPRASLEYQLDHSDMPRESC